MRTLVTAGLACAILTVFAGCAASPETAPRSPQHSHKPAPTSVESWSSAEHGEPRLTLYDDGTLGGFDGCNAFGGTYVRTDDLLELRFGYGTLKACLGVDMWLRDARTANIDGGTLTVYDAIGNRLGTLAED